MTNRGVVSVAARGRGPVQIVDLTHPLAEGMPVFPGLPEPSFRSIATGGDGGFAFTELHLLNHVGTHVDAPAHQIADGDTLDDIPLERLVTHALTIDVSDRLPGPIPVLRTEYPLHH